MAGASLRDVDAEVIVDRSVKGFPLGGEPVALSRLGRQGWSLSGAGMSYPLALLRTSALAANIETMRQFCASAGVRLAPHAKTTMIPMIVADQLDAGAWAMTAATPRQVLQLWEFGVRRVLLANEVVQPAALAALAAQLVADPDRELLLFVDSLAGVDAARAAMAGANAEAGAEAGAGAGRRLPVVLDVGHACGRTGVRDVEAALAVAAAVRASASLELAGVGGFEGTIGTDRTPQTLRRVDEYLRFAMDVTRQLVAAEHLPAGGSFVATFGGSAFFDRVVEVLAPLRSLGATIVLRSGCYVIHDHGLYERATPARTSGWALPAFRPALEVWTTVLSRPEPGLVLLDAGKRDLSFDAGLPQAIGAVSAGGVRLPVDGLVVSALSDQHAFLPVPTHHPIAVGDRVGLGVSHPCTTLDRWPLLHLADDDDRITGAVLTHL